MTLLIFVGVWTLTMFFAWGVVIWMGRRHEAEFKRKMMRRIASEERKQAYELNRSTIWNG
jgi:hypothetical protein